MAPNYSQRLFRVMQAAGHPVNGASADDATNRAAWRVTFPSGTTQAQITAATQYMQTVDLDAPSLVVAEKDAFAATIDENQLVQAVAQLDFEERQKLQLKAGQTLLTGPQCKARVKAIYLSLLP